MKLVWWPCLKGAASKSYRAHSTPITAAAFLQGDDSLITCGGNDLCILQWKHLPEFVEDEDDDGNQAYRRHEGQRLKVSY